MSFDDRPCNSSGGCTEKGMAIPGFCKCKEAAERISALEDAMVRVWWEFNQQHPDIRRIKELIAPNGSMPQPSR